MNPMSFLKGPAISYYTTLPLKRYHPRWRKTRPDPHGRRHATQGACCCTNSKSCRDKSTPELTKLEDRTYLQTASVFCFFFRLISFFFQQKIAICFLVDVCQFFWFFPQKCCSNMFAGWCLSGWCFFWQKSLAKHPSLGVSKLLGGWTNPKVSTHLKNMIVKMDHFPKDRVENSKNLWNHHLERHGYAWSWSHKLGWIEDVSRRPIFFV